METKTKKTKKTKRTFRVFVERTSKGMRNSTREAFETFRRELYGCGHTGALVAFSAGRLLRRNERKTCKLRITFGCGAKALDSMIRISRDGRRVFQATV